MYAEVQTTEQLSPNLLRVTLGGGTLATFEGSPATDAYINARFVPAGADVTVPFESSDLDALPAELRPRPRRFTIRKWDEEQQSLAIDFVVHGDIGYAGSWAQRAKPGDRLQFQGPGGSYRPSNNVDWHLLAGDESAFGAIGASIESLDAGAVAHVFAVVEQRGYEIDFPSDGDVTITWLYRNETVGPDTILLDAVEQSSLPGGTFDVFVHGEAAEVRAVRKHLVNDRGIDASHASISAYWRRDHTDEAWRQIKRQWNMDQARDH